MLPPAYNPPELIGLAAWPWRNSRHENPLCHGDADRRCRPLDRTSGIPDRALSRRRCHGSGRAAGGAAVRGGAGAPAPDRGRQEEIRAALGEAFSRGRGCALGSGGRSARLGVVVFPVGRRAPRHCQGKSGRASRAAIGPAVRSRSAARAQALVRAQTHRRCCQAGAAGRALSRHRPRRQLARQGMARRTLRRAGQAPHLGIGPAAGGARRGAGGGA